MAKSMIVWDDNNEDSIITVISDPVVVIVCDRCDVNKLCDIDEAGNPGVYILMGDDNRRYVGQASTTVLGRLKSHDVKKDWWTKAVVITREDGRIDRSQLDYLEKTLISRMMKKNFVMDNVSPGNNTHIESYQKGKARQILNMGVSLLLEHAGVDVEALGKPAVVSQPRETKNGRTPTPKKFYTITVGGERFEGGKLKKLYSRFLTQMASDMENREKIINSGIVGKSQFLFRDGDMSIVGSKPGYYYGHLFDDYYTVMNLCSRDVLRAFHRWGDLLGVEVSTSAETLP